MLTTQQQTTQINLLLLHPKFFFSPDKDCESWGGCLKYSTQAFELSPTAKKSIGNPPQTFTSANQLSLPFLSFPQPALQALINSWRAHSKNIPPVRANSSYQLVIFSRHQEQREEGCWATGVQIIQAKSAHLPLPPPCTFSRARVCFLHRFTPSR